MSLPEISRLIQKASPQQQPHRNTGRGWFLKGPIPLAWLMSAARLPGRALHIGVLLWFRAGLTRSKSVKLSGQHARLFDIDRHAKARALHQLERARLVSVYRARGRSPVVTILPYEHD